MNKKLKINIFIICLICTLHSVSYSSFENTGFGIRPAGLAYSFTAMCDDANSVFYNPAGLGRLRQPEAFAQYTQMYIGLDDKSSPITTIFGLGFPLSARDCIGTGYYSFTVSGLYNESILLGSYSRTLSPQFILGATGKILAKSIGTEPGDDLSGKGSSGFDIDLGLIYKTGGYTLGAAMRNVMQPNMALTRGYADKPSRDISFAIAFHEKYLNMNLELNMQQKISTDYNISGGAEQWFVPTENSIVAIRGGLVLNTKMQYDVALGLSYRAKSTQIDYALKYPLTGIKDTLGTHFIGLTIRFKPEKEIMFVEDVPEFVYEPPPVDERIKIEFETTLLYYQEQVEEGISLSTRIGILKSIISQYEPEGIDVTEQKDELKTLEKKLHEMRSEESKKQAGTLYESGKKEYLLGSYAEAPEKLSEAKALNPEDKTISDLMNRLQQVTAIISEEKGEDADSLLLREGVTKYLENDIHKSLLTLYYVTERNPEDEKPKKVLKLVEVEYPEITIRIMHDSSIGIMDQLLERALEHIYERKYTQTISKCNDVLYLEPDNVLAFKRIGSAYYAMNNLDRAKEYWAVALALDPNDKEFNQFLKEKKLKITPSRKIPARTPVSLKRSTPVSRQTPETVAEGAGKTYVIKKGDTLRKIAEDFYKDRSKYKIIYDANRDKIKNPFSLPVGQEIVIPSTGEVPTEPSKPAPAATGRKYVIQEGDKLPELAEEFYGDRSQWRKILDANKDKIKNPFKLPVGQEIDIP